MMWGLLEKILWHVIEGFLIQPIGSLLKISRSSISNSSQTVGLIQKAGIFELMLSLRIITMVSEEWFSHFFP